MGREQRKSDLQRGLREQPVQPQPWSEGGSWTERGSAGLSTQQVSNSQDKNSPFLTPSTVSTLWHLSSLPPSPSPLPNPCATHKMGPYKLRPILSLPSPCRSPDNPVPTFYPIPPAPQTAPGLPPSPVPALILHLPPPKPPPSCCRIPPNTPLSFSSFNNSLKLFLLSTLPSPLHKEPWGSDRSQDSPLQDKVQQVSHSSQRLRGLHRFQCRHLRAKSQSGNRKCARLSKPGAGGHHDVPSRMIMTKKVSKAQIPALPLFVFGPVT